MSTTYHEADHPRQTNGRWEEKRQTDQGDDILDDPFRDERLDDIGDTTMESIDAERRGNDDKDDSTTTCPTCEGTGRLGDDLVCSVCHGRGWVHKSVIDPCPQCGGQGRMGFSMYGEDYDCDLCGGTGIAPEGVRPANWRPPISEDDLAQQTSEAARNLIVVKLIADQIHHENPAATAFELQISEAGTSLKTIWVGSQPTNPDTESFLNPTLQLEGITGLNDGLAQIRETATADGTSTHTVKIPIERACRISWDDIWSGGCHTLPL